MMRFAIEQAYFLPISHEILPKDCVGISGYSRARKDASDRKNEDYERTTHDVRRVSTLPILSRGLRRYVSTASAGSGVMSNYPLYSSVGNEPQSGNRYVDERRRPGTHERK